MSSSSLPQGSSPAINLTAQTISVCSDKKAPASHMDTSVVHQTGDSGDTAKTVGPKVTVEMIPKVADIKIQPNLQNASTVMSNLKTAKHSAMPATVAAKQPPDSLAAAPPPPPSGNSGASMPHHIGLGGLLQPHLLPSTTKIAGIAPAQVTTRGSHITTVKPGLPAAASTIMRTSLSGLPALPGKETVLSPVYMYQQLPTGPSQIQAKLLAPPAVMAGPLRLQGPAPSQTSANTDHNRNLGGSRKGQKRGPYQTSTPLGASGNLSSKTRGQAVISTDSKLPMTASPHVQPIALQVKTDGTHQNPYHSPGVPPPAGLMQDGPAGIPSGMIANHQQLQEGQSSNQKQDGGPPLKVEVRMVICSDQQDKVKSEAYRVDQVVGRPDKKDGRVDTRRDVKDSKTAQSDQGSKTKTDPIKMELTDPTQNAKDIRSNESKERSGGIKDSKKVELNTKGERDVDVQRVYRPEKKMSLKADIRHEVLRPGEQPSWQPQQQQQLQGGGGGVIGLSSTRHSLLQPSPQKTRMTVSPSMVVPTAKPHIRAHTVSSVAPSGVPSSAAAILVSANTPPVSVRQQTPNAIPVTTNIISSATIPVAKVYPRQQQTQPPPQQLQQHGGNARVITSGVRLPVSTGTDTTSAPTNSFQPMQQSINRAPILPPTLQNLSTGTGHNNRQHGPPPHTVISTQQPFHHAHNRYNFTQEIYGYPMLQPYQGHPYGPLQNSGIRGAQDGHPRYPYVTTSASLSTVAGHPHATPIRYPLAMMIDPMTMGLTTGVQTAADGHTGDGTHVTGSLNQVGPNPTSDSPTAVPNSGASPRPSILRKRASESSAFRRHPISTLNSSHLGRPDSPASKVDVMRQQLTPNASPKPNDSLPNSQQSAESNASETSTDTAPSSVGSVKIKPDPDGPSNEGTQNSNSNDALPIPSQLVEEGTPSPRKKQRKQDLKAATEHPDIMQDPSTDEEVETKPRVSYKSVKKYRRAMKAEHMKVVHYVKRTCPRLMDAYKSTCSWKPALNHFERYTDVKPKDEKKVSIHEIANQRGIIKKTEGWKIKHISGQFEDLTALEQEIHDEIEDMKRGLGSLQKIEDDTETATVYELVQGSLQRSKYVIDNLGEARTIVMKLLEHKPKVSTILKKHANKRHAKKKNTSP